jgi:FAD/FMN-containing dehydrogenase
VPVDYEDASGYRGRADEFLRPSSEAEVVEILRRASTTRTPVTIVGGLTGLTGGAAARSGWAVSMERLSQIDIRSGSAICGPGVRLQDLQAAARPTGQFFAPDPTESLASLGGAISTNASGSRSFRYGSTARHVLGLRVALLDGRVLDVRRRDPLDFEVPTLPLPRTTKNSAGYRLRRDMDWIDLFSGAEGTLGVITQAEVQLLPLPAQLLTGVIFFDSDEAALDAVDAWRPIPGLRMLEYCDRAALHLIGVPHESALLIEQELSATETLDRWLDRLEGAGARLEDSWTAASDADRERFRRFRHSLPETVLARVRKNGFMRVGSDYAVPLDRNREMIAYYRRRAEAELPGIHVIYGHIGDAHVHVNTMPESQAQYERAQALMHEFAEHAVALGGTVSAEHGLGKRKASLLRLQYTEAEIDAMRAVKRRFDPDWLLGQGTLFEAA